MMQDLAMYILDLANNAIKAQACNIRIYLEINDEKDSLVLTIEDDGCGMSEEMIAKVTNPFYTTRSTRKVGLGLAFVQALADQCEGKLEIYSDLNVKTSVSITIKKSHIDTPPLGDIAETMMALIHEDKDKDYYLRFKQNDLEFIFDTVQIKDILSDVSINDPKILLWIKEYINESITQMREDKNEIVG